MPITLNLTPQQATVGLLDEPQLCYALLTVAATGPGSTRPVNWALVADASRSMRIPIVDEAQFRALVQQSGAQEALVDGVPVWQLSGPVPPEVRAVSRSALDYVTHAVHTLVERLDAADRLTLVAFAEEALLAVSSTPGNERPQIAQGIRQLQRLNLGEQTDLAPALALALQALASGRDEQRAERLLLLTDGFTQHPELCIQIAADAAAHGVTISTIGLGGEFQEAVLTTIADLSGGHAVFLHRPNDIPRAVAQELDAARAVAARALTLRVETNIGVALRRATRIRPALAPLFEHGSDPPVTQITTSNGSGQTPAAFPLHLGDLSRDVPFVILLEFLAPAQPAGVHPLARLTLESNAAYITNAELAIAHIDAPPALPDPVLDAAARASVARLQRRANAAIAAGASGEAARLLHAAAARLDDLGKYALAEIARSQAKGLDQAGQTTALATKELTYALRRLGA